MSRLSQLPLENETLSARRHFRNRRCARICSRAEHVCSHLGKTYGQHPHPYDWDGASLGHNCDQEAGVKFSTGGVSHSLPPVAVGRK